MDSNRFSTTSAVEIGADIDPGERRLNELGYKQELRREASLFKCIGFAFSTVGLFSAIILFGPSLAYTGPVGLVWGWFIVSFFTVFIGLALAEICSSFPVRTFGLLGVRLARNRGYSRGVFYSIYLGFCLIWAILNTSALKVVSIIDVVSLYWQVVGGVLIIILLPAIAPVTQSAEYVFTHFEKSTDLTGIHSTPYALVLSLSFSQFAILGYDAAAHLTEETSNADRNGPIAILASMGIICVVGCGVFLSLIFSIQDPAYLFDPSNETGGGFIAAQILYDAFHGRYGSGAGAVALLCIIWGTFFAGGLSCITSAARIVYALSRDGGTPGSRIWVKIHPTYKVPVNAVWLSAFITALIGLPVLGTSVAFTAIISVCGVGWMGSYAIPIFFRMIMPRKNFTPGPFHLGKASRPICAIALLWICYFICVFLLPTLYPLTWESFNYAPVVLGIVLSFVMSWWVLDARKWFNGPVKNII